MKNEGMKNKNYSMLAMNRSRKGGKRPLGLLVFFIFHAFIFQFFISCDDYDSFTSDYSASLTFSRDTLLFDTLLTTIPSSTLTLSVYNRGDKGLRISEVWLANGKTSPFRINIDGQDMSRSEENRVTDFEIKRRDSIIVRAEVTLPEFSSDVPREVKDVLVFRLESGREQRIPLVVVGRDAFFLRAHTLLKDTVISDRRPVVIYDSLVVAPAATLTLAAGAQLYFHDGAMLTVRGRLLAQGTLEAPVVLRGDRTDHMFDYLPYDNLPNRWGGVVLTETSMSNELTFLDLHSGNFGILCDSSSLDERKLLLTNSIIHNVGGDALSLRNCRVEVYNTEISNAAGRCVYQAGGDVRFLHCTIAQFYPLSADRGFALELTNVEDSLVYLPLVRADYCSSVITGYADDVILFPSLDPKDFPLDIDAPQTNYLFRNCFLATEVPDDEDYAPRFLENVFDTKNSIDSWLQPSADDADSIRHEKNFILFDTHNFLYDFTPKESSPIRGLADPKHSADWPLDRLGRNRLADGAPDAGCYEFVKKK